MNEKQIIQKLQSKDKGVIPDIPTLRINEKSINFNALIAVATKGKVQSKILALIDIANLLERKTEFEVVLAAHYDENFEERTIEDAIFPYKEFRKIYFGDIIEI